MSLDLGSRIRDARVMARLTQAQLADGICTASYLSFVEAGKRVPSEKILGALAKRLGLSAGALDGAAEREHLLRLRLAIEQAAPALANGAFAEVEQRLAAEIGHPALALEPDLRLAALTAFAAALEGQGKLQDAVRILREAVPIAGQRGQVMRQVDLQISLIRCLREVGDLAEATDIARGVVAAFPQALHGSSVHARLLSTLIGLHRLRGDITTALVVAEQAIKEFPVGSDDYGRAVVLWNASGTAEVAGQPEQALLMATEAAQLLTVEANRRHKAGLHQSIAYLYRRVQPPMVEAAAAELDVAEALYGPSISAAERAYLEDERANVALLRGEFETAVALAESAIAELEQARDALVLGRIHLTLARAKTGRHDLEGARAAMERAQSLLALTDGGRESSQVWRELGDAFYGLGATEQAMAAYRQALTGVGLRSVGIEDAATVSSIRNL